MKVCGSFWSQLYTVGNYGVKNKLQQAIVGNKNVGYMQVFNNENKKPH